jgi:cobalt-zinc-cadmium resistance protein CzcA
LKKAGLEVALRSTLKKTAVDLPKTDINYSLGQQNSPLTDDRVSISQTIPFPGTWKSQGKLLQEQVVLSRQQLRRQQHELDWQVKQVYSHLAYLFEFNALLQRQDSIFGILEKAAEVKFRTGESGILEKTTATTQRLEFTDRIRQNTAEINITGARLNALVQAPQPLLIRPDRLPAAGAVLPADTAAGDHPLLAAAQQQIVVAEREQQAEKSKLSPHLTVGYFNQSLQGAYDIEGQLQQYGRRDRFQGLEAGIALPLWYGSQASRIRAAGLNKQIATAALQNQQQQLQQEQVAARADSQRLASSLAFYRDQVLVNADLTLRQADKAYRSGEAGYLNYLQAADQGLRIRQHYLQLLLEYQLNQHQLQYLSGN